MPFPSHLRARQRLVLFYAVVVAAAATVLAWVFPEQQCGIALMGGVGLLSAWIIAHVGNRHIRQRLHVLREATDALGGGKLVDHIRALPNDEFVKLTESVDRLADQMRSMVQEREQLRQRLSRSEQLAVIGELAAIVAHEVNNPLDGLQNSLRIIRRRAGNDPQTRGLLQMMDAGLSRIETTVRRLLSMSRDERINLARVPVDQIVDEALVFVQPRLNRYGIKLVRDFAPEPVLVKADVDHMAQALINLMMNSADAMKTAGGILTVRCRCAPANGTAWLEVVDTGCGIEEAHLPHIFEPFYSTKSRGAGTGLGLAVVARVVEAHNGRIEVQSRPSQGTCFRIGLPAGVNEAEESPPPVAREEYRVLPDHGIAVPMAVPSQPA